MNLLYCFDMKLLMKLFCYVFWVVLVVVSMYVRQCYIWYDKYVALEARYNGIIFHCKQFQTHSFAMSINHQVRSIDFARRKSGRLMNQIFSWEVLSEPSQVDASLDDFENRLDTLELYMISLKHGVFALKIRGKPRGFFNCLSVSYSLAFYFTFV